jgi:hypothetical protein
MKAKSFSLKIDLGNDLMLNADDVAAALEQVARRVHSGALLGKIKDENGNTVGAFEFKKE